MRDITAIALLWQIDHKTGVTSTRADKHSWILQNLYKPVTGAQLLADPYFKVLDLSTEKNVFDWDNGCLTEETLPKGDTSVRPSTPTSGLKGEVFRITPATRIYSMSQKYRVAIVVDVSASMRVVDVDVSGMNRVLIPLCFETLCNCLDGMSRPYAIKNSWTGETHEVHPEIYVTIIAKAGASMGYRPDLSPRAHSYISRHPIHVILQDVQVNSSNLFSVSEWIYNNLNAYENEMIALRHMDDKNGPLEHQNPSSVSMAPTPSVPSQVSVTSFESFQKSALFTEPAPLNTLEHGLLALRLLPLDCKPVLIVLTDGVSMSLMKGDFIYRDVCRRLAKDTVHVTIIQVGSNMGFYPGVNFGYVPDNEALRFLALTAFGKFIYSSDCHYLDPAIFGEESAPQPESTPSPNFYHRNILFRETHLQKSKKVELYRYVVGPERPVDTPRIKFINSNTESSLALDPENEYEEIVFPWNTKSLPPVVGEILCGFKDYTIESTDLAGLIHTRLLEGFAVKSVHVGGGGSKKQSQASTVTGKSIEKVEIILMRPWLPNVTIQYTIKARFVFDTENVCSPFLSWAVEGKAPRIELNILAHHSFALNFVNVEGGNITNDRLLKLHNYLRGIHESDALVKILIAFNQKTVMNAIPKVDPRIFAASIGSHGWGAGAPLSNADQGNIWNVICSFMINKAASFDDWDRDVILRSSNPNRALTDVSSTYPSGVFTSRTAAKLSQASEGSQGRSRLPSALIHIMNILANQWSSFAINRTTFVKFYPDDTSPTGFAVLRLVYETDWLLSIRMSFFNVPIEGRQRMGRRVCTDLGQLSVPSSYTKSDASSPGVTYSPIRICSKPIRRMMLRYRFSSNEESTDTSKNIELTSSMSRDQTARLSINDIVTKAELSAVNANLISPVGPRSYLRSYRWIWLADVNIFEGTPAVSFSKAENVRPILSILDLALYLLYFSRLEDGYLLVSHLQDCVTMYREVVVQKPVKLLDAAGNEINRNPLYDSLPQRQIVCGVQYIILVDRIQKTVVTELWVEPILQGSGDPTIPPCSTDVNVLFKELHEVIAKDVSAIDSRLIESLYTFDRIHHIGRLGLTDTSDAEKNRKSKKTVIPGGLNVVDTEFPGNIIVEASEPGRKSAIMQTNYDIDAVLRKAEFASMLYSPVTVIGSTDESKDSNAGPSSGVFSPLMAIKSESDIVLSRNTSPNLATDSARGSVSNDYIYNRRSSQSFALGKSQSASAVTKPVLSIGLCWDTLISCSPVERTQLMLYKFFQISMNFVTDGEVAFKKTIRRKASTPNGTLDIQGISGLDENILEKINGVLSSSFTKLEVLTARLEESICFVKIRDAEQFILTLIPKAMLFENVSKKAAFAVTTLQCSRLQVHSSSSGRERLAPMGFDRCATNIKDKFTWSSQMTEADTLNVISDGAIVLKGETGAAGAEKENLDDFHVSSAEYIENFVASVNSAYGNAHCQTVYAALLQDIAVSPTDIEKALSSCIEIGIDIDLTSYLNVLTLRHKSMNPEVVRLEKIHILNSVRSTLNKYFKQILTVPDQQNIYFYNPDDGADGCLTPTRLDCAESPLFIKTECIFKKSGLGQGEIVQIPAVAIPTSYVVTDLSSWDIDAVDASAYPIDFTPRGIGTDANPLQSTDGTIGILQITCLCLIRPTKFDADYDDTAEVYEKELDDPRLILSRSKSSALYETVDQLKSILEDEIMNGLLELPIKSDFFTMEYIKNSLSARHKIPSNFGETDLEKSISLSSSCICDFPLTFVHEIPNSEFASTEFSKLKLGTKSLSISQIKEYFCITGTCDWDNVKRLSFAGVKHVAGLEPRLDHGPFGDVVGTNHGLGISLTASVNEILSNSHIVQQKNWILLTFKNDYARVWYFSRFASLDEKLNMLSWVQNAILDTCNRVSKMLLLQLLKKKHRANRLLIERSIHDEVSDDEDDDDDASSSNAITFIPNQFACPMVFSRQFSIHWRVKPSLALNAAVSSISVLAITNRKNMFVFEAGGIIVYFKLSIKEVEGEFSPTDTSRMGSIDEINLSTEALNKDSPKTASPVLSRTRGAPISSFSAHKSSESYLLLEFFGVDTPGPTITSEFVTMIESKLSLLTQREIGTYMSRNMKTVRLTPSDVDFILPAASKSPQRREFFKIPAVIDHPFKFLLYLKQALLLNLTSLPPNDLLNTLTAYYDRVYGIAFSDADLTKDNAQDINFGEMALLYNSLLARGASRFENSVGAGTAVVCLSLLNANRQVIGTVSEPPPPTRSSIEPNIAKEVYETLRNNSNTLRLRDYDLCLHDECPVMLNVEIWWSGSINADCLLDFVFKCYQDTMLDYLAECSLMYFSKLLLASRPASSLSQLDIVKSLVNTPTHKVDPLFGDLFDQMLNHLKVASCLNNSAVEELSSPIKLPATIMDGLATESRDLLIETSSALSPVLISRVSSGSGVVDLDLYSSKPKSLESADRQILILSGLQELQEMYGSTSSKPDGPIQKPSRSGSLSDTSSESLIGEQARPTSINQGADSRRVNMENVMFYKNSALTSSKGYGVRSGFFMMLIESSRISVATYNLNKSACEDIFNHILRILSWNNIRMQFLESGFGFEGQQESSKSNRYQPSQKMGTTIDYSSSYVGVGGLGHAAMKHFEKRTLMTNVPESSDADHLRQMYNSNSNSLQRSAVALLDSYVRRIGTGEDSVTAGHWSNTPDYIANQIRSHDEFWRNPQSSNSLLDTQSTLSAADLATILRSVRLHFVHYPIFFSSLRESLLATEHPSEDSEDEPATTSETWFMEMISKFSADYVSYLVSLGFETLNMENYKPKASDEWISVPSFAITKDLRIEVPPLYLVKNIKGGVFIVQIGVDGFCVAINSYMLRYPSGPLNPFDEGRRYGAENESDIQFKSDCNFFKGSLHVHSFSYDFHIRYFQHILDHQPNCVIDLLDVMKTFEKYNSSRFVYARSRMLVGECLTEAQHLSASLFQYILKNPRIYGFKSISHNGVPTACFLTSEFPDFAAKHSQFEKGPFCYTVVIYMSQDTNLGSGTSLSDSETSANSHRESKLRLRYFLLIIDRENSSPLQGLDTKNQSFVNQSYAESLKEYLSGGCYLGDIAKFAEKKIEQLVEQAIRYYDRDSLWRQLLSNDHPTSTPTTGNADSDGAYEWTKMFLEKISPNSRCLLQIVPSLINLFGNPRLPWPQLLAFLQTRFAKTARVIYEDPKLGRMHVLFLNPRNSDYLIHVIYWKVSDVGLPQPLKVEDKSGLAASGLLGSGTVGTGSGAPLRVNSNSIQRKIDEDDRLSVKARLRGLESLGVKLAKPGEYQIDIVLVNREGLVDEAEFLHVNELVNAICSWLWNQGQI